MKKRWSCLRTGKVLRHSLACADQLRCFSHITPMTRPAVTFVLGGPGSGKGTISQTIVDEFGFVHLSAGKSSGTSKGELIASIINKGFIVPSEITIELLRSEMEGKSERFLIDGFPRNLENLNTWDRKECSEEEMVKRLLGRGQTSGRDDDKLDIIKKRLEVFRRETLPVLEEFEKRGKLRKVNASNDVATVSADTGAIIRQCLV